MINAPAPDVGTVIRWLRTTADSLMGMFDDEGSSKFLNTAADLLESLSRENEKAQLERIAANEPKDPSALIRN